MRQSSRRVLNQSAVVPARQTVTITKRIPVRWLALLVTFVSFTFEANAELFDSMDAYPPRWHLDTSDCDARVLSQKNLSQGGVDDGGCESLTFHAGVGSEALLIYPVEPLRPTDDLVARLFLLSARDGARVGLRVRFPYLRDTRTRRPISSVIYGGTYRRVGKFDSLVVSDIERPLKIKTTKLRATHGVSADLRDPYVDAIVINAYSGPGETAVRIDDVSLKGMIPVGDHGRVAQSYHEKQKASRLLQMKLPSSDDESRRSIDALANAPAGPAFPQGQVVRILEHRGEPLQWVRSLGFDAILLSSPPTASILREAIQARLLIYAPPPVAPDPALQTLLDPLMAWYLGGGVALDNRRVEQTDATVRRLRKMPDLWRRPILVAPTEGWARYANLADGVVTEASLRSRGLSSQESSQCMLTRLDRLGMQSEYAIAVSASPPTRLLEMNQSIASAIGAPADERFRWQAMWCQSVRVLEHRPRAILFRSSESLVTGTAHAHQRSMALSYINRFIAMLAPWVASAKSGTAPEISDSSYRCACLKTANLEFLLLTSGRSRGEEVLAGDGQAITVKLAAGQARKTAWRLSDFSAERLDVNTNGDSASLEIISPDFAEVIVLSSDATTGADLNRSALRFAKQAASDRWQLANEQLHSIREAWKHATRMGATDELMPVDLLTVADRTIRDAEPYYRAGDTQTTLRLARRADAWSQRAAWRLTDALTPDNSSGRSIVYLSSPPLDGGRPMLQVAWDPLMGDEGWGRNLLSSGDLDQPGVLDEGRWLFGQREVARTTSAVEWIDREYFSGFGAVRLTAGSTSSEPLAGGYEGTVARLSSPSVTVDAKKAIRIDAMVRTIGFGGAHQGILVYDSLGGPEMGVLVRGATQWTPVRLYRQSEVSADVRVMFEIMGDGEAIIDEVGLQVWDPEPLNPLPFRPLDE